MKPPAYENDPEARITALLLGELNQAEAAEVRSAIAQDPELAALHDRLKQTIAFVRTVIGSRSAGSDESQPAPTAEQPRLSDEKRETLLKTFKVVPIQRAEPKTRPQRQLPGWVGIAAIFVVMGLLAALTIPNFVRARESAQSNAVINSLRQIDGAKQQWALENNKSVDDVPTWDDIKHYMGRGPGPSMPPSVVGEEYVLGRVGESPVAFMDDKRALSLDGYVGGDREQILARLNGPVDGGRRSQSSSASLAERELASARFGLEREAEPADRRNYFRGLAESAGVGIKGGRGGQGGFGGGGGGGAGGGGFGDGARASGSETVMTEMAPIHIELPIPAFMGTPTDIPIAEPIEKPSDEPRPLSLALVAHSDSRERGRRPAVEIALPNQPAEETSEVLRRRGGSAVVPALGRTVEQRASERLNGPAPTVGVAAGGSAESAGRNVFYAGNNLWMDASPEAPAAPAPAARAPTLGDTPLVSQQFQAGDFVSDVERYADAKVPSEPAPTAAASQEPIFAGYGVERRKSPTPIPARAGQTGAALSADASRANVNYAFMPPPVEGQESAAPVQVESRLPGIPTEGKARSEVWRQVISRGNYDGDGDLDLFAAADTKALTDEAFGRTRGLGVQATPESELWGMQSDYAMLPSGAAGSQDLAFTPLPTDAYAFDVNEPAGEVVARKRLSRSEPVPSSISAGVVKGKDLGFGVQLGEPVVVAGKEVFSERVDSDALASGLATEIELPALTQMEPAIETSEGLIAQEKTEAQPAASQQRISELKREVENTRRIRDAVQLRLRQEQVDLAEPEQVDLDGIRDVAQAEPESAPTLLGRLSEKLSGQVERSARVSVAKEVPDVTTLGVAESSAAFDPYFVQTEFEKIQSAQVLDEVVDKLNLGDAWAGKYGASGRPNPERARALLKERIQVEQAPDSGVITIRAKGDDPEQAARIANTVAEVYRETRLREREEGAARGFRVLQEELVNQEQKLAAAERQLEELEQRAQSEVEDTAPAPPAQPKTPPPVPQPEVSTSDNPFSTFSLNVTDVSFKLAQASLEQGQLPDPGSIRSEEFINALEYHDPAPSPGRRVGVAWERTRYPFAHNRDLLRFGVQTAAQGREAARPLNVVLCVDNSGSMERADRVAILREAMRVLGGQLQAGDRISVVAFARTPRLWVDGLPGEQASELPERLGNLNPEGGTNLEDALNLAYDTARRHFVASGVNRVVLLTDGAANLGNVNPETLRQSVIHQRNNGIALDTFGVGWEGYNDDLLETLSRNGDGRYGFLNTPEEAATEFADQLAGALRVAASDVKVQVEFNPRRVKTYRQIGYAKHQLTKEQFRDNTVDAAEIGAAESGNALYVIETDANGVGPVGVVRVRFKVPETGQVEETEWMIPYEGPGMELVQASPAIRLAGTASAFSEWLAGNPYAAEVSPPRLLELLRGVPEVYSLDPRPRQLEWMIRQAGSIAGQ